MSTPAGADDVDRVGDAIGDPDGGAIDRRARLHLGGSARPTREASSRTHEHTANGCGGSRFSPGKQRQHGQHRAARPSARTRGPSGPGRTRGRVPRGGWRRRRRSRRAPGGRARPRPAGPTRRRAGAGSRRRPAAPSRRDPPARPRSRRACAASCASSRLSRALSPVTKSDTMKMTLIRLSVRREVSHDRQHQRLRRRTASAPRPAPAPSTPRRACRRGGVDISTRSPNAMKPALI